MGKIKQTEYNHLKIEKKWQKEWLAKKAFQVKDVSNKKKYYTLIEFPYPSGDGLHVGHIRSNTAMDIVARKRRAEGFDVLYPMGWDAFGLPTENYAIRTGVAPAIVTKRNINIFKKQLHALGFSFDWSREVNTTDPKYFKWTQWIFLQLLKNDLAYKARININWCPKDKIGLANEEVVDGSCERCGALVEKREKEQWMLRITKYADRLDKDLDEVDYLEKIKIQQRNWIGRSTGAEISFEVFGSNEKIDVFTTRADTIFGATYLVLSPESELVRKLWSQIQNKDDVRGYIEEVKNRTEIERTKDDKEKTGKELVGIKAINPATREKISVWIADYVLSTYGTGAIMAVPAHDERDFQFAKKFNLPIREVIYHEDNGQVYTGKGILINSGKFNGQNSDVATKDIIKTIDGKSVTRFKLRDWVFSRQRYWGEPIPVVHCASCGIVPLPEKELPLKLPKIGRYEPTDTGESPLASISNWVNTICPKCGAKATRETDTMPNWAGSSWYFLRYVDPKNNTKLADFKKLKRFMPVDWYNGGMEHTTLHLLYSRFWNKFLYDIGVVPFSEPYKKRTSHGMILAKGGEKMSKSRGNVVNPDYLVKTFGADTLRMYEMFMGPFPESIAWSEDNIFGVRRFLEKTWRLRSKISPKLVPDEKFDVLLNKSIKKVSEDIESMSFNTAVSCMMILLNEMERKENISKIDYETFLKILSPFAPHITEELWRLLGHKTFIFKESWPKADPKKMQELEVRIVVQINGKVRATCQTYFGAKEVEVESIARSLSEVEKWLINKEIRRTVFVPNKLINFVTS